MEKYFVYILKSLSDSSFYIGYTTELERRLEEHNSGKGLYTRRKIPWQLVYTEEFSSKTEALRREIFLKSQRNRMFYKQLIQGKK